MERVKIPRDKEAEGQRNVTLVRNPLQSLLIDETNKVFADIHRYLLYDGYFAITESKRLPHCARSLIASGASKREIDVIAHTGICSSYNAIVGYVKRLSAEGEYIFCQIIHLVMCSVV